MRPLGVKCSHIAGFLLAIDGGIVTMEACVAYTMHLEIQSTGPTGFTASSDILQCILHLKENELIELGSCIYQNILQERA